MIMFIIALFQYKIRNYINISDIFVTLSNAKEFKGFSGSSQVYTGCLNSPVSLFKSHFCGISQSRPRNTQKKEEVLNCHPALPSFTL